MNRWFDEIAKGTLIAGAFFMSVSAAAAADGVPEIVTTADVVLLGEIHDNPRHHLTQAEFVRAIGPKAVVWEMLTPEQARAVEPAWQSDPARLERELDWASSGWPAFNLYAPVFGAAADAAWFGAQVPRAEVSGIMSGGIAAWFGDAAQAYGLADPLPKAEQAAREADQLASHCNALPAEMLPVMVDIQRVRDAVLARAVVQALDTAGGGPVVVITGNGHARLDRGVPVYLSRVRPELKVVALGQSEDGIVSGRFDLLRDAPAVDRGDPCEAFKKK
jgi:uncharacterized iron-regulated protein